MLNYIIPSILNNNLGLGRGTHNVTYITERCTVHDALRSKYSVNGVGNLWDRSTGAIAFLWLTSLLICMYIIFIIYSFIRGHHVPSRNSPWGLVKIQVTFPPLLEKI